MIDYSEWTKEQILDEIYKMTLAVRYFHNEIKKRDEEFEEIFYELERRKGEQK